VETLEPAVTLRRTCYVFVAAFVGETRLIDNALIEEDGESFKVSL
jgi:pantothenate synthetase